MREYRESAVRWWKAEGEGLPDVSEEDDVFEEARVAEVCTGNGYCEVGECVGRGRGVVEDVDAFCEWVASRPRRREMSVLDQLLPCPRCERGRLLW